MPDTEADLTSAINELASQGDPDAQAAQQGSDAPATLGPDASSDAASPATSAAPAADRAPKMVPIQALDAVRGENKDLLGKVERMETRFQDFLQRLATHQPQQQAPVEEPPKVPALEEDPAAHLAARIAPLEQLATQFNQAEQMRAAQSQLGMLISQNEAAFASKTPDYAQALNHLRAVRMQELETAGITDPSARAQIIGQEELFYARANLSQNRNPAESIYKLAQAKGYKGAAEAAAAAAQPAPQAGNAQKLADIAKGMEASKSLSTVPGQADETMLKLEHLADLDGAAFDKAFDKLIQQAGGSSLRSLFH